MALDAAILFSDILVVLDALGQAVRFAEWEVAFTQLYRHDKHSKSHSSKLCVSAAGGGEIGGVLLPGQDPENEMGTHETKSRMSCLDAIGIVVAMLCLIVLIGGLVYGPPSFP